MQWNTYDTSKSTAFIGCKQQTWANMWFLSPNAISAKSVAILEALEIEQYFFLGGGVIQVT